MAEHKKRRHSLRCVSAGIEIVPSSERGFYNARTRRFGYLDCTIRASSLISAKKKLIEYVFNELSGRVLE